MKRCLQSLSRPGRGQRAQRGLLGGQPGFHRVCVRGRWQERSLFCRGSGNQEMLFLKVMTPRNFMYNLKMVKVGPVHRAVSAFQIHWECKGSPNSHYSMLSEKHTRIHQHHIHGSVTNFYCHLLFLWIVNRGHSCGALGCLWQTFIVLFG